jgi:16S rRNA (guanine966-N2)-methyltransferase
MFLDPPYASGLAEAALARVCNGSWLVPSGLVSLESDRAELAIPDGFAVEAKRRFGKAQVTLLRRSG